MNISSMFSLSNAIRLMVFIGLLALFFVLVQSCQRPKTGLQAYATGGLKKLTILDSPPSQPQLIYGDIDGNEMRLSDYKDKVILLNVWATWCAPCIIEMPMLNELQALKGGPDFEVVNISLDRTPEEVALYLKDNELGNLKAWHDKTYKLPSALDVPGLPVSVIYDRKGQELARLSGEADWTSPEALIFIDKVVSND